MPARRRSLLLLLPSLACVSAPPGSGTTGEPESTGPHPASFLRRDHLGAVDPWTATGGSLGDSHLYRLDMDGSMTDLGDMGSSGCTNLGAPWTDGVDLPVPS